MLLKTAYEETLSDTLFKTYHKRFVSLDESNLKRVAQGHDDSGYIILSANELNDRLTLEMKKAINSKNLTFVSTYGGYREKTGVVVEKSFIVYPYRRNNTLVPWDEFIKDVYEIVNKTYVDEHGDEQLLFNQESILVKKPNESLDYVNSTNEEMFLEPEPSTSMESHSRYLLGELFDHH